MKSAILYSKISNLFVSSAIHNTIHNNSLLLDRNITSALAIAYCIGQQYYKCDQQYLYGDLFLRVYRVYHLSDFVTSEGAKYLFFIVGGGKSTIENYYFLLLQTLATLQITLSDKLY